MTDFVPLSTMLEHAQRQSHLRLGVRTAAHGQIRQTLAENPAMAEQARAMLAAIEPDTLQRDHITRWMKATLEDVLRP